MTGEVPFRKAYRGAIVDRNRVEDRELRRIGRKDVLEPAPLPNGAPPCLGFAVLTPSRAA